MKVVDLDGKISYWSIASNTVVHQNKSDLHLKAREILRQIFPTLYILEEIPIYLRKNDIAYLDFYLPLRKTAIEIQGEQHFKYISFFHGTVSGFIQAQKKDAHKIEWCRINNINLIELLYSETLDEWKKKLI